MTKLAGLQPVELKINVTAKLKLVSGWVENIVGKGENVFKRLLFQGL